MSDEWTKPEGEARMTDDDIRDYVQAEIEAALPDGWIVNYRVARESSRKPAGEMRPIDFEWKIFRPGFDHDYFYYHARLDGLGNLMFFHNNGPYTGGMRWWRRATLVGLADVGEFLRCVFAHTSEYMLNDYTETYT